MNNTENADKKQTNELHEVGCCDLLALSYIREIVGDENHILTNEELIADIRDNYIKPVKRSDIPAHLRGENLAERVIKEREFEKELNTLKNYITNHVLDEIYNQYGGNTDMIEELRSMIS